MENNDISSKTQSAPVSAPMAGAQQSDKAAAANAGGLAEALSVLREVKAHEIDGWMDRGFTLPTALRARIQALLGDDNAGPICRDCNDTGEADSGGTHPWGEPAMIRCGCDRAAAQGAAGQGDSEC